LGPAATDLVQSFAIDAIRIATMGGPADCLLEDGLALWKGALNNIPAMTPEMLRLFDSMANIIQR